MANGNKHTMDRNFQIRLANSRGQTQSRDTAIIAQNLGDLTIPENLDFLMPDQSVLHDLLGPQRVTTMHQRYLFTDIGEIEGFLNGSVATTDHSNLAPLVEKPITGGTGGDTAPIERLF